MSANLMCTRCKVNARMFAGRAGTGCLCDDCEDAVKGMTQEELAADWAAHQKPKADAKDGNA